MEITVGAILEGKVTGITKFGAFVSLPENKTGMVHISEIAHAYVSDINEHLHIGQEVKVKVIGIDPGGKINLSIKKTMDPPARQGRNDRGAQRPSQAGRDTRRQNPPRSVQSRGPVSREPQTFDDMLKQFMADSDSKISSIKQYSDHRTKNKRRQ